jgi:hypothetical protein
MYSDVDLLHLLSLVQSKNIFECYQIDTDKRVTHLISMTLTLFYLFLVSHGALSSDHDFAAGLQLELLGSHTTGTQNSSNKIELKLKNEILN